MANQGGNIHPAIVAGTSLASSSASPSLAGRPSPTRVPTQPRSSSRGRTSTTDAAIDASSSSTGSSLAPSASLNRPNAPSNIPLPSPSAVHINQSLEDSLRRGEEERARRSIERRERRRKRIESEILQQQQQQQRHHHKRGHEPPTASSSSSLASLNQPYSDRPRETTSSSTSTTIEKQPTVHEDSQEGDVSQDSMDDSALITSPSSTTVTDDDTTPPQSAAAAETTDTPSSEEAEPQYDAEGYEIIDEEYDSDFDGRSLTRQLAETAVSVREMSKELGRARVKSNIQSVLIVTKARDNQLIKLTREVALYLMKTPRYGRNRGLIVYVDSQLKRSKRFDAAGIERDNPELFRAPGTTGHHHHHHHHHHNAHHSPRDTPATPASGSTTPRRTSTRRASAAASASASSINLFGMTRSSGDYNSSTASLASLDRTLHPYQYSGHASGSTTPAPGSSKPMTKLTEALVSRQLDRQLEKEHARRQSMGQNSTAAGDGTAPRRVAFSANAADNGMNGNGANGDDQTGLLRYWTAEMCSKSPHLFDLVVTLGGDGTVLFTSWLFQHVVPPVIPFALGSLGFLTCFDFSDYKAVLETAINDGVRVNLRMRFTATIYRAVPESEQNELGNVRSRVVRSAQTGAFMLETATNGEWENRENCGGANTSTNTTGGDGNANVASGGVPNAGKDKVVRCSITRPVESFEVLNDLVVDRGPSPYVSLLELFGDENHLTTVQADGLCVATPTGSTAYSLSAGGSLVHPEIPTLLITPICPHTLSFRPMLLPDSMELRIAVPYNSRSTAWASFDGRGRVELRQGDHIKVMASTYPFPTVCADKQSTDWFQAITRTLKWNERQRQKSFVVLEHDRKEPHDTARSKATAESGNKMGAAASSSSQNNAYANVNGSGSAASTSAHSRKEDLNAIVVATPHEDNDDDDGGFDIDDISPDPLPPNAVQAGQKYQAAPRVNNPGAGGAHNEREGGSPTIRPPSAGSFHHREETGPKSPSEHDYSHSSAQHLRQYATYSSKGESGGSSSGRDRTPRVNEYSNSNSNSHNPTASTSADSSSASASNSRDSSNISRSNSRRPYKVHSKTHDRVKAFVVFGADSSDRDSSSTGSASDDDTDEGIARDRIVRGH